MLILVGDGNHLALDFSIGVTKEQARLLDMKGDPFICPPCQGQSFSALFKITKVIVSGTSPPKETKSGRLSDESLMIKRKRIEGGSPNERKLGGRYEHLVASKPISQSEPSKRPKTGIFFHRDAPAVCLK